MSGRYEHWQLEQYYAAKSLVDGEFIGRNDKNEVIGLPSIHEGDIVCGAVSKSDVYKSNLKNINRKVLALETESGGAFHSAQSNGVAAIAVRGICDYADKNKNKLEEQTGGNTRRIAADNVVTFIATQFYNPQFIQFLRRERAKYETSGGDLLAGVSEDDFLSRTLAATDSSIEEHLKLLLPGYKPNDPGYRLPLPRIRARLSNASISPVIEKRDPISPLEAVVSDRIITITLPRSYPDRSLPWVLAAELSRIEINGKRAVPFVVESDQIKPPNSSIAAQLSVELDKVERCERARPVIIVTDLPPDSKSRIVALQTEMEKYPEAHFVIMNKHDHNVAAESELSMLLGSVNFDICDIAFVEVASFFQRYLGMSDQESGVLSLKLRDMFEKFDLNAHPSYFAGVGADLIYSLLKANRRSELIELAVGGYLSFVVASDAGETIFSRSTREAFLRRLVFEQKVLRRQFSKPDLVGLVEEFAGENDYKIDSIAFIKAFSDKGLVHYEDGFAVVSLPFVESYLLAKELASRPQEAVQYFNLDDDDFDFAAFDLYAELGPHIDIVRKVSDSLSEVVAALTRSDASHVLLTDEIRPRIVEKKSRLRDIQEKLESAFDDVVHSRPNSVEKQRILDIAGRIQDSARTAQEDLTRSRRQDDGEIAKLRNPIRLWAIATVLLGSGSESLKRDPKRELARKIVQATSLLIDALLRAFPRLEFEEFKADIQSEATLREIFEIKEGDPVDPVTVEFVGAIVDAYEFAVLGYPMRVMLDELGNAAGQKVLEPSVASVELPDDMQNLVAKVWASEINAHASKDDLVRAIKRLPPSPFLRFCLSTHFMARVFWNQWEPKNRLALLDAAEAAIEPLKNAGLDKGRLKRLIRSGQEPDAV